MALNIEKGRGKTSTAFLKFYVRLKFGIFIYIFTTIWYVWWCMMMYYDVNHEFIAKIELAHRNKFEGHLIWEDLESVVENSLRAYFKLNI